jgi:hypothetical protein
MFRQCGTDAPAIPFGSVKKGRNSMRDGRMVGEKIQSTYSQKPKTSKAGKSGGANIIKGQKLLVKKSKFAEPRIAFVLKPVDDERRRAGHSTTAPPVFPLKKPCQK